MLIPFLKNDVKLLLSDWKTLVIILIMPVLLILYFSYAVFPALNNNKVIQSFDIGLVDKENSIESRILSEQLANIELFDKVFKVDEIKAKELIHQNKIAAAIVIPDGFTQSINTGENKSLTVLGNARSENQARIVRSVMQSASNIVSSGQGLLYTYYYFVGKTEIPKKELQHEFNKLSQTVVIKALERKSAVSGISTYPESNLTPSEYYTSALFALFLMFSGMPMLKMLVNERVSGISKRILAANSASAGMFFSKILLSFVISSIQIFTVIIVTSTVLKNYWGASKLATAGLIFSGIFCVSAWSLFVGSIARTLRSAEIVGNLGMLLMTILGGSIYPLAKMPDFLKPFSAFTINKWFQEGLFKIFSGNKLPDVTLNMSVLIMIGIFLLLFSSFLYRVNKVR